MEEEKRKLKEIADKKAKDEEKKKKEEYSGKIGRVRQDPDIN